MTKEEVKAAQPDKIVHISQACTGLLNFGYNHKKLYQVQITSLTGNNADQCALIVAKSLITKYGTEPSQDWKTVIGNCGIGKIADLCRALGGEKPIRYNILTWNLPGVGITLTGNDTNSTWTVTYLTDPSISTETISKF